MTNMQTGPTGAGVVTPVHLLRFVSLGDELVARHDKPVAPCGSGGRGRDTEAALLRVLLEPPGVSLSTVDLREAAGASNLSGLVIRTRDLYAVDIDMVMVPCINRRGRAIRLGHYSIQPGPAAEHARAVLARLEGLSA
jgi:hypothetical protein